MYFGKLGAALVLLTAAACTGGSTGDAPSSFAPDNAGAGGAGSGGGGASSSSAPPAMIACDPLGAVETAIALEEILGVGKDASGKLYVVDKSKTTSNYRVFISSDPNANANVLQRHDVSGSGSTGDGVGEDITIDVDGTSADPLLIKLERSSKITKRMGVRHGTLDETKTFEIGSAGSETLTVVGESAIGGLAVKNLEGTILVEYDATTAENQRIIVTRPKVDWKYEDFRLFIGSNVALTEARVKNASRGSTTFITFVVDLAGATNAGIEQTAIFPSSFSAPSDKASVKVGTNKTISMTVDPEPKTDGLTFSCINRGF